MKTNQRNSFEVQSTTSGTKRAMELATDAAVHLMGVLTRLYSDPEQAVLREISTNAWDAQVAAGVLNRPIEVTLPNPMSPFFKVRDFGIGLTVDDVFDVYSKYGASTKRNSNDFNGTLGLGCKAPLAYCDQFTVESIKDGVRITVNVARETNGAGSMEVVDTCASTEPDGTTVTVPTKRHNDFARKAADFYAYWPEGTVLVNGEKPKRFDSTMKVSDNLYVVEGRQNLLVMGNVAYPMNIETGLPYNSALVAFVNIGDVDFTPPREALEYTAHTKARIEAIKDEFDKAAEKAVQKAINAAPSHSEALKTMLNWVGRFGQTAGRKGAYKYKGDELPLSFGLPTADPSKGEVQEHMTLVPFHGKKLSDSSKIIKLAADNLFNAVWFYGYESPSFSPTMRKKIDHWLDADADLTFTPSRFVLVKDKPTSPFIDADKVFPWETIKAIKLARVYASGQYSGRIPGSYDLYDENGHWQTGIPGDQIDASYPIYYVNKTLHGERERQHGIIRYYEPDAIIVPLTTNRVDKFKRYFPSARELTKRLDKIEKQFLAGVSDSTRLALKVQETCGADLRSLNGYGVLDPDVQAAIKLATLDLSKFRKRARLLGVNEYTLIDGVKWENPFSKYPLMDLDGDYYRSRSYKALDKQTKIRHNVVYINAVYAASQS